MVCKSIPLHVLNEMCMKGLMNYIFSTYISLNKLQVHEFLVHMFIHMINSNVMEK